jgi:hypothetical protein
MECRKVNVLIRVNGVGLLLNRPSNLTSQFKFNENKQLYIK